MVSNECILFDIDGVLVDTRSSYNKTIKKTVKYIAKIINPSFANVAAVTDDLIFKFRQSGKFNNDADTTYALLLSIACAPDQHGNIPSFISRIADNATSDGIRSVEEYLSNYNPKVVKSIKMKLSYPNGVKKSLVTRIFDEHFYGPMLFKNKHSLNAEHYFGKPLINNDKIIIKSESLREISELFSGRMGIISGRSKLAAQYALGNMYSMFRQEASVYLEDEKRFLGKPNPYSLERALKVFSSSGGYYVGDSVEDLIMSKLLNRRIGYNIQFIGVYGLSVYPNVARDYFLKHESLTVKNVNEIPNILYKVGN
ncbi:MAG: hypothetical protein M3O24_00960 [Thermoproteota archaeon]|nr:hypothetical protein [Thermoproteota archaeon]